MQKEEQRREQEAETQLKQVEERRATCASQLAKELQLDQEAAVTDCAARSSQAEISVHAISDLKFQTPNPCSP